MGCPSVQRCILIRGSGVTEGYRMPSFVIPSKRLQFNHQALPMVTIVAVIIIIIIIINETEREHSQPLPAREK